MLMLLLPRIIGRDLLLPPDCRVRARSFRIRDHLLQTTNCYGARAHIECGKKIIKIKKKNKNFEYSDMRVSHFRQKRLRYIFFYRKNNTFIIRVGVIIFVFDLLFFFNFEKSKKSLKIHSDEFVLNLNAFYDIWSFGRGSETHTTRNTCHKHGSSVHIYSPCVLKNRYKKTE